MTYPRYDLRTTIEHDSEFYRKKRKDRGAEKRIVHFTAPKFELLTDDVFDQLTLEFEYWGVGSRFYKLADKHYGDPNLWWIIAFFNRKPTDFHVKIGETIAIPSEWEIIYNLVVETDEKYT